MVALHWKVFQLWSSAKTKAMNQKDSYIKASINLITAFVPVLQASHRHKQQEQIYDRCGDRR